MRTVLEIQEKALAALVRVGDANYHHTQKEERNKKGYLVQPERRIYRVCDEQQYGLRKQPREEPIAKRCCASCQHKDYIDMPIEGQKRVRQGVRICQLLQCEVAQCEICDNYKMIEAYKRV